MISSFCRFLALSTVNQITIFEPESHRFRAEHYVSSAARAPMDFN